jgi:hypothetical protein
VRHTIGNAEFCRLRFIFDDAVVSLTLATDSTIEDIARILGGLPEPRYRAPVSIDITLRKPVQGRRRFSRSISAWPRIVSSQYSAMEEFVRVHRSSKESERADSGYDTR